MKPMKLDVGGLSVHWLSSREQIADDAVRAGVHPTEWDEAQAIRAALRRAEYLRSRYLLRRLTGWREALPRTAFGGPAWPPGLVGSLTHKDGHVGLCLADASRFASVGIDAEDVARVRPELADKICSASERALLTELAARDGASFQRYLALAFSFKEALFKSHHPLGGVMFWFHDAEITALDPAAARITARVLVPTSPRSPAGSLWHGAYADVPEPDRELILTTTAVTAS